MDTELLIALCVLWLSTTVALIIFLTMWFFNDLEAFHPHSVDVDKRHHMFLVVSSTTECKMDFAVKSISAFAAPRGSSSSKYFTVICVMIAVAGFLGTSRWYAVGDAKELDAMLAFLGFASLLLVAGFEMDVVPERFLEEKLRVTGWLLQMLKADKILPFQLSPSNEDFIKFIRESPELYPMFHEDMYILQKPRQEWKYHMIWNSFHVIGAIGYTVLVCTSIILNDIAEEKIAWITTFCFIIFGFVGYLTGSYLPVLPIFQGWILTWNPFVSEPHFMFKLVEVSFLPF